MIDVVLCKMEDDSEDKGYIFLAPKFSYLMKGEKVVVETRYGIKRAIVIASASMLRDSDSYNLILKAKGLKKAQMKRVLKKVVETDLNWEG